MKKLLLTIVIGLAAIALSSCGVGGGLEASVGIDENDNAMQCVRAEASTTTNYLAFTIDGSIDTSRIELPAWLQSSNVDDATVEELVRLFDAIATIAENLNCPP